MSSHITRCLRYPTSCNLLSQCPPTLPVVFVIPLPAISSRSVLPHYPLSSLSHFLQSLIAVSSHITRCRRYPTSCNLFSQCPPTLPVVFVIPLPAISSRSVLPHYPLSSLSHFLQSLLVVSSHITRCLRYPTSCNLLSQCPPTLPVVFVIPLPAISSRSVLPHYPLPSLSNFLQSLIAVSSHITRCRRYPTPCNLFSQCPPTLPVVVVIPLPAISSRSVLPRHMPSSLSSHVPSSRLTLSRCLHTKVSALTSDTISHFLLPESFAQPSTLDHPILSCPSPFALRCSAHN